MERVDWGVEERARDENVGLAVGVWIWFGVEVEFGNEKVEGVEPQRPVVF